MEKRLLGMILVGAAAGLILISVVTKLWWTAGGGERGSMGIGPLSMEECRGERCRSRDLASIPQIWSHAAGWVVFGNFTFYFGLASMGVYGFSLYRAGTRKPGVGGRSAGISAISAGGIIAATGTLFLVMAPSELTGGKGGLGMSAGYPLLLLGAGAAIAGGIMLRKWEQEALAGGMGMPMQGMPMQGMPMQPVPMQQPMAGAPMPGGAPAGQPCPTCGQPARWVPEYSRWWCDRDQKYV